MVQTRASFRSQKLVASSAPILTSKTCTIRKVSIAILTLEIIPSNMTILRVTFSKDFGWVKKAVKFVKKNWRPIVAAVATVATMGALSGPASALVSLEPRQRWRRER